MRWLCPRAPGLLQRAEKEIKTHAFSIYDFVFVVVVIRLNTSRTEAIMTQFSYIYTNQAKKFAFYRIPQILFTDERFANLSTEAKVLYGLIGTKRQGIGRANIIYVKDFAS